MESKVVNKVQENLKFDPPKLISIIDIISAHSPGEEYIGERKDLQSTWSADNVIVEAFCTLNGDEEN
ncbi:lipoxygenase 3 chloroplastic-like [Prunus yedoensis var. nudiflora]|uniref:Lipoxygenase 3 chloroplastic-like n=1 Tax=Prunus yedoensis var. nudiflora TaxID=2094558 RepID=A0A314UIX2_PRUYE|nr:lipoxygenase 3 chloroplastic-like [Prunus yedoensis var. nudiflora]